jgi:FKBP-type peptidyl-prolyl cis-trans isomerase
MKYLLYMLLLVISLSGMFSSCKEDTLTALEEHETTERDKYVREKNLSDFKDVSGLYFKDSIIGAGDTISSGYLAKIYYRITLLDGTVVFTSEDKYGHNYEEHDFYVDVNNDIVNASYIQQIAGLHKGLKKMRIGGHSFMVIPSQLAFKALDKKSTLGIPRFSTLLATVHVVRAYSPEEQKEQLQQ